MKCWTDNKSNQVYGSNWATNVDNLALFHC